MKHLEEALGHPKQQQPKTHPNHLRQKSKIDPQKWTLDPDILEESPQEVRERLTGVISAVLMKKFQCEKYLQEVKITQTKETFRDVLRDLVSLFPHYSTEVDKLSKIQEILQGLSDCFSGELKNYIKQFQSLLDAKIRKLKKKGKRQELVEFDRLLTSEAKVKRKNEVYFINEDDKGSKYTSKHLTRQHTKNDTSKRSFGTINSASNENQSGSGKNQSGSGSKSGESNALAVLLANIDAQEQRKGPKNKQKQKEKYEFTSILNATNNVRQRHNVSRIKFTHQRSNQQPNLPTLPPQNTEEKDEAFIFHHPKLHKQFKA